MDSIERLRDEIDGCRLCPRLVEWRERVAVEKRASFADEDYWGKPVPAFGDPLGELMVVGLAHAAHGGNRTGRVFTGDRSADWVFRALHRAGYANQSESVSVDDGLDLDGVYVTAAVRCAPPANKPTTAERDNCLTYLEREMALLDRARVVVALGGFAYTVVARLVGLRPRPKFGHGVEVDLADGRTLICSYHPSQQNTFIRRLTEEMFDSIFSRAREITGTVG